MQENHKEWENGQKAATRRCTNNKYKSFGARLGEFPAYSPGIQLGSIRANASDHEGGNSHWRWTPKSTRANNLGKILERLDKLENSLLEYVSTHQQQLNERIESSKQAQINFLKESSEIRSDIYDLISGENYINI